MVFGRRIRTRLELVALLALPFPAVAQTSGSTLVTLPFSTSISVPWTWRSSTPAIEAALRGKRSTVDGSGLMPDGAGTWLVIAAPISPGGLEASVILVIMPTGVSQRELALMTKAEVASADRNNFRPEAEQSAANTGRAITSWEGTTQQLVGGRYGLVTRYTFSRQDGPPLRQESYAVYLGSHSIIAHAYLPAEPGTKVERDVQRIISSMKIGVDSI